MAQPSQLVMEKYCRSALASLQVDSEMKSKLMEEQHFVVTTKLTRKEVQLLDLLLRDLLVSPFSYVRSMEDCC